MKKEGECTFISTETRSISHGDLEELLPKLDVRSQGALYEECEFNEVIHTT